VPGTDSGSVRITKCVTGTYTNLGSGASATTSVPFTLKNECNGSSISSYFGGTLKETITDTSIAAGTRGGLCANPGATLPRFDNWELGDLALAIKYPRLERAIRGLHRGLSIGKG
jgi:hypothetical protein